jgi:prophage tail gpP-like protein
VPQFDSNYRGATDDQVSLVLNGSKVLIAESYDVDMSILSQPSRFSLRLGHGDVAKKLITQYPPNTPFQLYIGNSLQQTGFTDGFDASGRTATEVTFMGYDGLAPLHRGYVSADEDFSTATYSGMTRTALTNVGMDPTKLVTTGTADRSVRAGVPIPETGPARNPDLTVGAVQQAIQARMGETWFTFLRRYFDRVGFFLWAAADGSPILSEPNSRQPPAYRIVRRRGQFAYANVIEPRFTNDASHRFSTVVVYNHGGGRKLGRAKSVGSATDPEMVSWGIIRQLNIRDVNCQNEQMANFLAMRKLAEGRRAGWKLSYTMSGHTTPSLLTGGRAVWAPDTIVQVEDDEFGLNDVFWIDSVRHSRNPETTTTITLMRPVDLLFGVDDF